jgi:glycosyltransferase involved in cell wall biosynthesis
VADLFNHRFEADRLMVIIEDRLSDLIAKGEITSRYYNPGELFREVHLVLTKGDEPDPAIAQKMVGEARLVLHHMPSTARLFKRTLGWRPFLLRSWAAGTVAIARDVRPSLIRCHGARLNAFAASRIKQALGVPYVVSMHINPELDLRRHPKREGSLRDQMILRASVAIEKEGLKHSDCTVCVYRFIEGYARQFGARRVEVIYNVINPDHLVPKTSYALSGPVRVVAPGRQFVKKDPSPLIEALVELPNVRCTLIGDGPYHERLKSLALQLGVADRCEFHRSVPNDRLCSTLKDYDILASINDYGGVSKVELEAAHVGLPILTNPHPLEAEPEVLGSHCLVVAGDTASIRDGLQELIASEDLRRKLGTALRQSVAHLHSDRTEAAYVKLYRDILGHA